MNMHVKPEDNVLVADASDFPFLKWKSMQVVSQPSNVQSTLQHWLEELKSTTDLTHARSINNSQIVNGSITLVENATQQKVAEVYSGAVTLDAEISDLRIDVTGLDFAQIELYILAMTELSAVFGVGLEQQSDFRYGRFRKAKKLLNYRQNYSEIRHF